MSTVSGTMKIRWSISEADLGIDGDVDLTEQDVLDACDRIRSSLKDAIGEILRMRNDAIMGARIIDACVEFEPAPDTDESGVEVTDGPFVGTLEEIESDPGEWT